jgi:LPXTG-motif cell wall-anchored protein
MDDTTGWLALVGAASLGMAAVLLILRRERHTTEDAAHAAASPFATSTEGMKRCPKCGVANLVTDDHCSACGRRLAD